MAVAIFKKSCVIFQITLNLSATATFLPWLKQHWDCFDDHVPLDKSLKDERITEIMLTLDAEAVDQLIDVRMNIRP